MHKGGGAIRPLAVVFCSILKKYKGNPYLKILDFFPTFCCGCPYEEKQTLDLPPLRGLLIGKIGHA